MSTPAQIIAPNDVVPPDYQRTLAPGLPPVAVMDNKYYVGANDIAAEGAQLLTILPFEEAFETPFHSDAHFVPYLTVNTGFDRFPRMNKPVLGKMRAIGCDIQTTMLVLDYDNPGHKPWHSDDTKYGSWGFFLRQLSDMADNWPVAWQWTLLYGTKNGARLVYVLDNPVPVDVAEGHHIWLCNQFTERGINVPIECCDWTHLFRLPWVTRDNVLTWEESYAEVHRQYEQRLEVAKLGVGVRPKGGTQEYGTIHEITNEKPSDDCEQDYLTTVGPGGRRHHSEFWKIARKKLQNRDCFPCIFDNVELAKEGSRSSTIMSYVGQATTLLCRMPACTPEHIYALFFSAVKQLEPAPDTPDWTEFLWYTVCRCYAREMAKIEIEVKKAEAKAQAAMSALEMITAGMRKWCNHPALNDDRPEVVLAWVSQHLIVSTGRNFMIIKPDGTYDPMQVTMTQLIPRLNIMGMNAVIQTQMQTENGGLRPVPVQQIINDHCTIVSNIRAMPEIEGAFIEEIDAPTAQIVIPAYHRSQSMAAQYNPDVDSWLHKLFGDNYELGIKWIGWALAWDEGPICALSIAGKAGSGKKMLAQGLCECLRLPKMATTEDLVGSYQYGLFQSPFLVVNEGWPTSINGMHPADKFRQLVSGDIGKIVKKYQDPVDLKSPVRIIFTANNLDVVKMLAANKDLSPDDREALSIRLFHLSISEEAADWLKLKGGTALTGRPGARWISGDGGEPSDFIVAKHFMFLYQNRKKPVGARFLVEGNHAQQIMFDMRTGSGNTPLVIETIIRLLEAPTRHKGVTIEDGELYILHDTILTFFREEIAPNTRQNLSSTTITNVLRGLVKAECKSAIVLSKTRADLGRKYWQNLDARLLLQVAQRDGMTSAKLEALVAEQDLRASGIIVANATKTHETPTVAANILQFGDALMKANKGVV